MKVVFVVVAIVLLVIVYKSLFAPSPSEQFVKRVEKQLTSDLTAYTTGSALVYDVAKSQMTDKNNVYRPESEWRKLLNELEFEVAFRQGTERPFSGELNSNKKSGVYRSKISGNDLFHSEHKFDSGTGWPSFYQPVHENNIILREDNSLIRKRIEVVDRLSGAHLGHVFNDGPPPTGLRYCINSEALMFVPDVPYVAAK